MYVIMNWNFGLMSTTMVNSKIEGILLWVVKPEAFPSSSYSFIVGSYDAMM